MPISSAEMQQKIDKHVINMDRWDGIVNGPETGPTSTVPIDSGTVPTFAKFLADKDEEINVAADGILAQSVAARDAAQAAEADAEDARDQVVAIAATLRASMLTIALAQADDPDTDPVYYDVTYRDSNYVVNSGARYRKVNVEPSHALKFQNGNGAWYELDEKEIWTSVAGTIGDGVADDTTPLANIADYFIAKGGGGIVNLMPSAIYSISMWNLTNVVDLTVNANGAKFVDRTGHATTGRFINLGAGVDFSYFDYTIPTGLTRRRIVYFTGVGAKLRGYNITSVDQQNNRASPDDAAITVNANFCYLGDGKITNFDNGFMYNADYIRIGRAECETYVRGHYFKVVVGATCGNLIAKLRSVNASVSPGHNGVLISNATNTRIDAINVEDAGEHGVRFGGAGSTDIEINYMLIKNSDGCGLKFRTENFGNYTTNVNLGVVILCDSGVGPGWGPNEEGLLLERCMNITIDFLRIYKENKTQSCARGFLINSSNGIRLNNGMIEDCEDQAVYIENTDDNGVNFRQVLRISLKYTARNCLSDAFRMQYGGTSMGYIDVDVVGYGLGENGFNILNFGGTGTINGPCTFNGTFAAFNGGFNPVTGSGVTAENNLINFQYTLAGIPTIRAISATASGALYDFRSNVGAENTRVAIILRNGNLQNVNGVYGTISDARIKSDIVDLNDQWEDIKQLKVRAYTNLLTGERHMGLIANEVKEISPGLVEAISDDEESIKMLSIAHPEKSMEEIREMLSNPLETVKLSLLPLKMLQVVQQMQARIESLEGSIKRLTKKA